MFPTVTLVLCLWKSVCFTFVRFIFCLLCYALNPLSKKDKETKATQPTGAFYRAQSIWETQFLYICIYVHLVYKILLGYMYLYAYIFHVFSCACPPNFTQLIKSFYWSCLVRHHLKAYGSKMTRLYKHQIPLYYILIV